MKRRKQNQQQGSKGKTSAVSQLNDEKSGREDEIRKAEKSKNPLGF